MEVTKLQALCTYLQAFPSVQINLDVNGMWLIVSDYHNELDINKMWELGCEWNPSVRGYTMEDEGE